MVDTAEIWSLRGRVALVTGAGRGMGLAHARALSAAGADVIATDISMPLIEPAGPGRITCQVLDVSDADGWAATADFVERTYGRLDVLVNNAGVLSMAAAEELDAAGWRRTIDINAGSVWLGLRSMLPLLRRSSHASVINVSSVYGLVGAEGYLAYVASKGAVTLMTKSAAITHGPDGIRVNSVHPGAIETDMLQAELDVLGEDALDAFIAATPLRRSARPEEVSNVIVFLASDASSFVSGAEIVVDGGLIAGR